MKDINDKIKTYLELQIEIFGLKKHQEMIRKELKSEMMARELTQYEDSKGNIVLYNTQKRETLNKKRVRELLGELQFKEVIKTTTSEVLKVISKKSKEKIQEHIPIGEKKND